MFLLTEPDYTSPISKREHHLFLMRREWFPLRFCCSICWAKLFCQSVPYVWSCFFTGQLLNKLQTDWSTRTQDLAPNDSGQQSISQLQIQGLLGCNLDFVSFVRWCPPLPHSLAIRQVPPWTNSYICLDNFEKVWKGIKFPLKKNGRWHIVWFGVSAPSCKSSRVTDH